MGLEPVLNQSVLFFGCQAVVVGMTEGMAEAGVTHHSH